MAKKTTSIHSAEQVRSEFTRRLARGENIDEAASKAGLNDAAKIHEYVADFYRSEDSQIHNKAEAITIALSTLKEICASGEESDKIRCDAAKALLQFVSRSSTAETPKRKITVDEQGTSIWDFER